MCGIAGFLSVSKNFLPDLHLTKIQNMMNILNHRGPDAKNYKIDNKNFFGLAHTRLSIQDLSQHGNQPMESFSKRYTIVFNGEIYNHFDIRRTLETNYSAKIRWRGTSDTETLVNAFELLGMDVLLKIIKGMFSFAIWDNFKSEMYLARDSMGEKPLFYGTINNEFAFSSEIIAMPKFFSNLKIY